MLSKLFTKKIQIKIEVYYLETNGIVRPKIQTTLQKLQELKTNLWININYHKLSRLEGDVRLHI